MATFRILHISDLHFSTRPKKKHWFEIFRQSPWRSYDDLCERNFDNFPTGHSEEIAELAASFIYGYPATIDLIAVTGDLATTGRIEFLKAAHSYTSSKAHAKYLNSRSEPTLRFGESSILLMPGNHDRYRDHKGNAGGNNFEFVFEEDGWPAGHGQVLHRVLQIDESKLAFVAADFCLRTNDDAGVIVKFNKWGRGKVYNDTVGRLVTRTKDIRRRFDPVAVVWAVHFPPIEDAPSKYRLNDSRLLVEAAEEHDIQLILAGHLHDNIVRKTKSGTTILCAGSLTGLGEKYWLHFIELDVEQERISKCVKIDHAWDDVSQEFAASQPSPIF